MSFDNSSIQQLGTILGIWAHPDDETWSSAAIMHQAIANGQRVAIITATRGDQGQTADENRWPQAELARIRTQELDAALSLIGVDEHYWFDYPDGNLAQIDGDSAVSPLAAIVDKVQPDTILTFGPDGLTGHPDHARMYHWSLAARDQAGSRADIYCCVESTEKYEQIGRTCHDMFNIYFATDQPLTVPEAELDLCFHLDDRLLAMKEKALRAQASQTEQMFRSTSGRQAIATIIQRECFLRADSPLFARYMN